jgi:predicted O-methyltransferase YrrM
VAWFHWRARLAASRSGDAFSLSSATRPRDLALLLELASGRRQVVELGTATAWTSISLALADPLRQVVTYDPGAYERGAYLALAGAGVRARITFVTAPGAAGPVDGSPVDLLYVDSAHTREGTLEELRAWLPVLPAKALVVLDDYAHTGFPGVREAVDELGLSGEPRGTMFVHTVGCY